MESNCCGAPPLWESDICSDCKEHADFDETDFDETDSDDYLYEG